MAELRGSEATAGRSASGGRARIAAMFAFHRDPLSFLTKVGQQGGLARFKMGRHAIYLVSSPELVQRVVAADQKAFAKGPSMRAAKPLFGEGLLRSEGELHARQRRLIQPLFNHQRIHEYASAMVEVADARQRRWREGERLDLVDEMRALTIAVIGRTLFSTDLGRDAERLSLAVRSAVSSTKLLGLPGYRILSHLPLPGVRRLERANRLFDHVFEGILEHHAPAPNGNGDLISTLLDPAVLEASDQGVRQVRDEAVTMMLAGHETTATTLALAWAQLATHPEASERFHAELDSVLGGRLPTADDLARLPYTEAIVNESLRLYPPSWVFSRVTTHDYELDGERIKPGSVLMMSQWVIHRKPELYPDPAAFRPERWIDGSTAELPKYAFAPFGGGPRKCIGEGFAKTEAALVLATIGGHWSMRLLRSAIEVEPVFTLQAVGGVPVSVHRRDSRTDSMKRSPDSTDGKEIPNRREGRGYWEEVVPIWDGGGDQRLWRRHSDAVNRRLVARWLPEGAGRALKTDLWDEAMGEGIYPALAANGTEVSGVDISEAVVAPVRERYPGLDAHRADMRSLPFEDRRFDAVVSNSSLDHFAAREEILVALRELRRVMRRGGTLVLTLDNPANPIVGLTRALPRRALNRLWLRWGRASRRVGLLPYYVGATYGHRQLSDVLTREGFAVEDMTAIMHAPRPLAVVAGHLLERRGDPVAQGRFLRWLMACERLSASPTRYLTGHFVAVRAIKL